MTSVRLIALVVAAPLFGKANALAQEGSKGTDPAGAYSISATTVTTARPGDKPNPKPASPAVNAGAEPNLHNRKKQKKQPVPQTQAPNKVGPANQSASSLLYVYSVDQDFPKGPPPVGQEYVRIGVTIWRFSPGQCPIPNCPLPAGTGKGLVDTATRIEDNSILNTGERVRLGLELLSRGGFVYIVDREQFADGTLGDAFLLFPTRNINDGKNWAQPGLQIQLPRAEGCFCVKSRNQRKVLVADNLIVIVSPTQLLGLSEIGEKEIPLPVKLASYVSRAEQAKNYRGSLRGGGGLAQTPQELRAGTKGLFDTEPVLTQSDLPPQNFYQSAIPRGTPAVFSFSLRYSAVGINPQ
jgi:hypothetical protein